MKTTRKLRILSLLAFLLLLAPFYDSCDGNYIHRVNADGTEIKTSKPFQKKVYDFIVDEEAFNAFEIASLSIYVVKDTTFDEFKTEISKFLKKDDWYKDLGTCLAFLFDFIILISFFLFILSFFKKQKLFTKLALVNCILVIVTFCYIVFLERTFEHWHQIKWGYYAFIITNLLILYYSKTKKPQLE